MKIISYYIHDLRENVERSFGNFNVWERKIVPSFLKIFRKGITKITTFRKVPKVYKV